MLKAQSNRISIEGCMWYTITYLLIVYIYMFFTVKWCMQILKKFTAGLLELGNLLSSYIFKRPVFSQVYRIFCFISCAYLCISVLFLYFACLCLHGIVVFYMNSDILARTALKKVSVLKS